jgi:hypothetical protein
MKVSVIDHRTLESLRILLKKKGDTLEIVFDNCQDSPVSSVNSFVDLCQANRKRIRLKVFGETEGSVLLLLFALIDIIPVEFTASSTFKTKKLSGPVIFRLPSGWTSAEDQTQELHKVIKNSRLPKKILEEFFEDKPRAMSREEFMVFVNQRDPVPVMKKEEVNIFRKVLNFFSS